jgi:hypothetical protein
VADPVEEPAVGNDEKEKHESDEPPLHVARAGVGNGLIAGEKTDDSVRPQETRNSEENAENQREEERIVQHVSRPGVVAFAVSPGGEDLCSRRHAREGAGNRPGDQHSETHRSQDHRRIPEAADHRGLKHRNDHLRGKARYRRERRPEDTACELSIREKAHALKEGD